MTKKQQQNDEKTGIWTLQKISICFKLPGEGAVYGYRGIGMGMGKLLRVWVWVWYVYVWVLVYRYGHGYMGMGLGVSFCLKFRLR